MPMKPKGIARIASQIVLLLTIIALSAVATRLCSSASAQRLSHVVQDEQTFKVSGTPNVQIVNGVDARLVRQTWQYSRVVIGSGQDPIVELNKAGADGWETTGLQLTESRGVAYVLKRPR